MSKRKRYLSEGVRNLKLKGKVFAQMIEELRKTPPSGTFSYKPFRFSVGIPLFGLIADIVDIVGMIYHQCDGKYKPGDTYFLLRSEWNEDSTP